MAVSVTGNIQKGLRNGDHGTVFRQNCGFDLSSNTSLAIVFTKPSGATIAKTDANVTIPSTDLFTDVGEFKANEYWTYTTESGDIDEAGEWFVQTTYNDASNTLVSDKVPFLVMA